MTTDRGSFPSTPARSSMPNWYPDLLGSVADRITVGRVRVVAAANTELLGTYWQIGRDILNRQDERGWGAKVIDRLSADLRERFPDAQGFSARNLKYMRAFAAAWPEESIVQRSVARLPWRHQIALLEKLADPDARLWYAAAAVEHGWSRDLLVFQIERQLRERTGQAITNFPAALPPADSDLAQQATRDPYLFDFLGGTDLRNERDLQRGLVEHVERFLLELGQGFAFVGQRVHLEINTHDFYADLLFYHLRLRRYVVIELKAVPFDPSFLGQLGLYMAAVDDLLAHPDDQPTIGLLLCSTKDSVVAEYALRGFTAPIGVAEWATTLATNLPADLAENLPSIAELEAELAEPVSDLSEPRGEPQ